MFTLDFLILSVPLRKLVNVFLFDSLGVRFP